MHLQKPNTGGDDVWIFNTHWDHEGEEARKKSPLVIMDEIDARVPLNDLVIIMGDFNTVLWEVAPHISLNLKGYRDTRKIALKSDRSPTSNGFGQGLVGSVGGITIDFAYTNGQV